MSERLARVVLPTIAIITLAFAPALAAHDHTPGHDHDHDHPHDHDKHADHDHEGHSHGAHVHGVAHLDAALDGANLAIEVRVPGWDLVGFERETRDDAERAKVEAARQVLSDGARLFVFEPADACTPSGPGVVTLPAALSKDDHGHDHGGDDHAHDKNASAGHPGDWTASWSFNCAAPAALQAIRVDWFDAFSGTERIEVQWIGPAGQAGHELTPAARRIPVAAR